MAAMKQKAADLTPIGGADTFKIDDRDQYRPGTNSTNGKTGSAHRIEMGPKDVAQNQVIVVRRDTEEKWPCTRGLLSPVESGWKGCRRICTHGVRIRMQTPSPVMN
jgi:prolyl-tRNA synthetase